MRPDRRSILGGVGVGANKRADRAIDKQVDLKASAFKVEFGDLFEDVGAEFDQPAKLAVDGDLVAVKDQVIQNLCCGEIRGGGRGGRGSGGKDGGVECGEGGGAVVVCVVVVADAEFGQPSRVTGAADESTDAILIDEGVLKARFMELADGGFFANLRKERWLCAPFSGFTWARRCKEGSPQSRANRADRPSQAKRRLCCMKTPLGCVSE